MKAPLFYCNDCGAEEEGTWRGDPTADKPGSMLAHAIPMAPDGWSVYDPGPEFEGFNKRCKACTEKAND